MPTPSMQNQIHELAKTLPPPRKQNTACDACRLSYPLYSTTCSYTDTSQVKESKMQPTARAGKGTFCRIAGTTFSLTFPTVSGSPTTPFKNVLLLTARKALLVKELPLHVRSHSPYSFCKPSSPILKTLRSAGYKRKKAKSGS